MKGHTTRSSSSHGKKSSRRSGVLPDYSKNRVPDTEITDLSLTLSNHSASSRSSKNAKDHSRRGHANNDGMASSFSPRGVGDKKGLDMSLFLMKSKSVNQINKGSNSSRGVDWSALKETLDKPSPRHKLAMDDESYTSQSSEQKQRSSSRLRESLAKSLSCQNLGIRREEPPSMLRPLGDDDNGDDDHDDEHDILYLPEATRPPRISGPSSQKGLPGRCKSYDSVPDRRLFRQLPDEDCSAALLVKDNDETAENTSENAERITPVSKSNDRLSMMIKGRSFRRHRHSMEEEKFASLMSQI